MTALELQAKLRARKKELQNIEDSINSNDDAFNRIKDKYTVGPYKTYRPIIKW